MKRILLQLLFLISTFGFAQVGVNTTTPDPSSMLDISATNKGVLVPRVSLPNVTTTQLDGINTAATGLLIWNTNAATTGGNGVGFYFFNGTQWMPITQTATSDHDIYEVGSTNPPNSITDNKFTEGSLAIGSNTAATGVLDVDNTTKTTSVDVNNTYVINPIGIDVSLTSANSAKTGVKTTFNGASATGNNTFISNIDNTTGNNNRTGILQEFNGTSSSIATTIRGVKNDFKSTASYYAVIYGFENSFADNTNSFKYGLTNNFLNGGTSQSTGVLNNFNGTGTGIAYGVYNSSNNYNGLLYGMQNVFSGTGNNDHFGMFNYFDGTGTGSKYGIYNNFPITTGGTHYGIYSNVLKSGSFAGYFLGNVSIGTNVLNNYILPPSRGTNGQIMQTDGSGNVSWVTPVAATDTDNQTIDVLSLTGDTLNISLQDDAVATQTLNLSAIDNQTIDVLSLSGDTLNLSLQNDGVATQTLDLSPIKDHDWYEVGGTLQPNAITDNKYTQGTVTIGSNVAAAGVLDIDNTSRITSLDINNSFTSNPKGINININSTAGAKTGVEINQSGTFTGFGGVGSMLQTTDNCSGDYNRFVLYNVLNGTSSNISISATGMRNAFTGNAFEGDYFGMTNYDFTTSNGGRYGVYNSLAGTGNGANYGLYNTITNPGTGNKYGVYNNIASTSGGLHYGVYSNVLKAGSYAGYFLGNVSIGTATTNNYILPPSRGTNGQIMQTDGSGNVSWVTTTVVTDTDDQATDVFSLTGTTLNLSLQNDGVATQTVDLSSLKDNDWFEVGGITQPDAITDNKYTFGDISIGKSTAASAKLDVDAVTKTSTLSLTNSNATAGTKWGLLNNLIVDTTNTNSAGIANNVSGNANFKYGIYNTLLGATTGLNYEYGIVNNHYSSGNVSGFALFNSFNPTASNTGNYTGLYNEDINANHTGGFVGVNNISAATTSNSVFGINNTIGGSGSGVRAGVYNNMSGNSSGEVIGTETSIMALGTGNKYGERITITNTIPGTHYGVYSDVTKTGSYAGYFLGNVSVGTNITNNYILPASRGTNGQIMRTDGSGNVSWVTPTVVTDTDDQIIDVLSLTGDTLNISLQDDAVATQTLNLGAIDNQGTDVFSLTGNTLNLSLQNDGVATQTVDLSSLANDWKLTGNAGTASGTNFIGTTDAQDLTFRTNNITKLTLTQRGQLSITNTGGSVLVGSGAGDADDFTINQNTFIGTVSGESTSSGNLNSALGFNSLNANTLGLGNTAVGANALNVNVDGNNNTGLGRGANVSTTNLINATAVGFNSTVNASNKIRLGNATITVVEGQVAYTNPSDARFKFNVQENVPGLDFIKKLKPVTYNFDTKKFDEHLNKNRNRDEVATEDFSKSTAIVRTGFLAQDVEKICTDLGYNFDGLHIPDASNPSDNYGIAYSQFIMPIVKAVQEQQAIIETQKTELEQLKSELEKYKQLEERIKALEQK